MPLNTNKYFQIIIRFLIWVFGNLVKDIFFWSNYCIKLYTLKRLITPVLLIMRDFSLINAKMLIDMTVVDFVSPPTLRYHLYYLLLSLQYNMRFQVCTIVEERNQMWSSTKVFLNSLWLEREVWNMFGVRFMRNDTVRCILTDYGFKSFPLMKNFPMTGYWQYQYDEGTRVIRRRKVRLMQEYRRFTLTADTHERKLDFEGEKIFIAEDFWKLIKKRYDIYATQKIIAVH